MKRITKILAFCSVIMFLCMFGYEPVKAAEYLRKVETSSQLFAVPEGGWSSINSEVIYSEDYTINGNASTFISRSKTACYNTAYATTAPGLILGNVQHSNGVFYKTWTSVDIIYPGKWTYGRSYENYETAMYTATTTETGTLAYLYQCDGGIPTTVPKSVVLPLKTR